MDWYAQQNLEERRRWEEESRDTDQSNPGLDAYQQSKHHDGNDTPAYEVKQHDYDIPF